ncbi:hypothetical protein M422DRAFT_53919 [Sphaerobolus stellatus SS14]|uniref:Uncharacterized protein n=1 Tax=Sphaerobolus stellatus (strain SS14) TaxID=990650 RepID=A0A0C9UMG3_SPHS4|nr:hypothetical protein M422DRAFT_53919 [Sphaerobolus stellatus SS14]
MPSVPQNAIPGHPSVSFESYTASEAGPAIARHFNFQSSEAQAIGISTRMSTDGKVKASVLSSLEATVIVQIGSIRDLNSIYDLGTLLSPSTWQPLSPHQFIKKLGVESLAMRAFKNIWTCSLDEKDVHYAVRKFPTLMKLPAPCNWNGVDQVFQTLNLHALPNYRGNRIFSNTQRLRR